MGPFSFLDSGSNRWLNVNLYSIGRNPISWHAGMLDQQWLFE